MTERYFNALCEACSEIDKKLMDMFKANPEMIGQPYRLKREIDKMLDSILSQFIDPGLIACEIIFEDGNLIVAATYMGERIKTHKQYNKLGDIIKIKLIEVLR